VMYSATVANSDPAAALRLSLNPGVDYTSQAPGAVADATRWVVTDGNNEYIIYAGNSEGTGIDSLQVQIKPEIFGQRGYGFLLAGTLTTLEAGQGLNVTGAEDVIVRGNINLLGEGSNLTLQSERWVYWEGKASVTGDITLIGGLTIDGNTPANAPNGGARDERGTSGQPGGRSSPACSRAPRPPSKLTMKEAARTTTWTPRRPPAPPGSWAGWAPTSSKDALRPAPRQHNEGGRTVAGRRRYHLPGRNTDGPPERPYPVGQGAHHDGRHRCCATQGRRAEDHLQPPRENRPPTLGDHQEGPHQGAAGGPHLHPGRRTVDRRIAACRRSGRHSYLPVAQRWQRGPIPPLVDLPSNGRSAEGIPWQRPLSSRRSAEMLGLEWPCPGLWQ
jgi:hypothetical protein